MPVDDSFDLERKLFEQALDFPAGEERLRFLKSSCGKDEPLLAKLRQLVNDPQIRFEVEAGAGENAPSSSLSSNEARLARAKNIFGPDRTWRSIASPHL